MVVVVGGGGGGGGGVPNSYVVELFSLYFCVHK